MKTETPTDPQTREKMETDAARKVMEARTALVLDPEQSPTTVFFATLALRLKIEAAWNVETMGTDGRRLLFNPQWTLDLTPAELRGVVVHEILHCIGQHPERLGHRDPAPWNIAADLAINPIALDIGETLPEGVLIPGQGKHADLETGKSAEYYHATLGNEDEDGTGQNADDGQENEQPDENNDTGDTSNEDNDENQEDDQNGTDGEDAGDGDQADGDAEDDQENGDGDQNTQTDGDAGDGDTDDQTAGDQDGDGDQAQDPGQCGGVIPPQDPAEAEDTRADWQVATAQAEMIAQARGELPGSLAEMVGKILHPKTPWVEILREFIQRETDKSDYSWTHPNRRHIGAGLYLPGLHSPKVAEVLVIVDRSGSVNHLLEMFCGQLEAMTEANPTRLVIYYHDTTTAHVQEWTPDEGPLTPEPKGGGGTSHVEVIPRAVHEHPDADCMICLTDLETRFPPEPPPMPLLWAAAKNQWQRELPTPPWGQVLDIGSD